MEHPRVYSGMAKGGVSQEPPVIEKLAKPTCPAKPNPTIRLTKLAGKLLEFLGIFRGNFEDFWEISGFLASIIINNWI